LNPALIKTDPKHRSLLFRMSQLRSQNYCRSTNIRIQSKSPANVTSTTFCTHAQSTADILPGYGISSATVRKTWWQHPESCTKIELTGKDDHVRDYAFTTGAQQPVESIRRLSRRCR